MIINLLLLVVLTVAALSSVLIKDLVKAAIGLAFTSITLAILMFRLASPLAGVFELSVCAGLITVIFMSTISLTKALTAQQEEQRQHVRARRYAILPVLIIAAAAVLTFVGIPLNFVVPQSISSADVRSVLWNERQLDLVGQMLVILAGFLGVSVLFKGKLGTTATTRGVTTRSALPIAAKVSSDDLEDVTAKEEVPQ